MSDLTEDLARCMIDDLFDVAVSPEQDAVVVFPTMPISSHHSFEHLSVVADNLLAERKEHQADVREWLLAGTDGFVELAMAAEINPIDLYLLAHHFDEGGWQGPVDLDDYLN